MTVRQFYDWQTAGGGDDVSLLVETLERREIPWCMIGGLAVNHWAKEPMATADVEVVIAAGRIAEAVKALRKNIQMVGQPQRPIGSIRSNQHGRGLSRISRTLDAGGYPWHSHARGEFAGYVTWKDSRLAGPRTPRQQTPEGLAGHHAAGRSASQTPQASARRPGEED
jgi:hypothetical protein